MSRPFVVVSGLPGSGRTTLARHLVAALGFPLIDKDDVLERPFEGKGTGDAAWRRSLSRESDLLLQAQAAASPGAVLVSFWRVPALAWEVTNQAHVHTWYGEQLNSPIAAFESLEEAIGSWPETATAVAVRLRAEGMLQVISPCGLEDLFGLVLRPNPRCRDSRAFEKRVATKRFLERWPRLRVLYMADPAGDGEAGNHPQRPAADARTRAAHPGCDEASLVW